MHQHRDNDTGPKADGTSADPGNVIRPPAGWWRRHRCRRRRHRGAAWGPELLAGLTDRVTDELDLSAPQREAWRRVTGLLAANGGALEHLRGALAALYSPGPAPVRLGNVEAVMVTGLDVLHQVRPAFESFYATLGDDQKRRFDALVESRRRRRRH
jgi:hypothetical protein